MPTKITPIAFVFTFLGVSVGFTFVGLPLILLAFALYWIISLFDIGTRIYIERNKESISSEGFGKGILKRISKSILMLSIITIFAHLRYSFPAAEGLLDWMTSVVPAGIVALFLIEEIISLIENSIEISGDDSRVLLALKKILGLGLDKGLSIAEESAKKITQNNDE
jgi:hypothetical protein